MKTVIWEWQRWQCFCKNDDNYDDSGNNNGNGEDDDDEKWQQLWQRIGMTNSGWKKLPPVDSIQPHWDEDDGGDEDDGAEGVGGDDEDDGGDVSGEDGYSIYVHYPFSMSM